MNERILPDCVGRLDDVTAAIRDGDAARASQLLQAEHERVAEIAKAAKKEFMRQNKRLLDLSGVIRTISDVDVHGDHTEQGEAEKWLRYRLECGWMPAAEPVK